jgi:predicted enzyme related to lactoylglutathione lyase
VHFEIPIDEPERASRFYRDVFGWNVNQWEGQDYWIMDSGGEERYGTNGALHPRQAAPDGVTIYMSVDDIDEAMQKIKEAGGHLLTGKMPVPGMGYSAQFRDPEGNAIGLFQVDSSAPASEEMA